MLLHRISAVSHCICATSSGEGRKGTWTYPYGILVLFLHGQTDAAREIVLIFGTHESLGYFEKTHIHAMLDGVVSIMLCNKCDIMKQNKRHQISH